MPETYTRLPAPQSAEECHFYHSMDIPGHGPVTGDWDLRGSEADYLGRVDLAGQRVLEIGPASGFLTFHMEGQGAELVSVELGPDVEWDVVPVAGVDFGPVLADRRVVMDRMRNGYWFAHERFGSRAQVHYGSAYELPDALGRFDVALMGSVLLHLRDPLRVVAGCAARADRLIITDGHHAELDGSPVMRLYPQAGSDQWDTWWDLGPDVLERFLGVLGFTRVTRSFHVGRHIGAGAVHEIPLFTLVAER